MGGTYDINKHTISMDGQRHKNKRFRLEVDSAEPLHLAVFRRNILSSHTESLNVGNMTPVCDVVFKPTIHSPSYPVHL